MNAVFHSQARELYDRSRAMMKICMIYAVGGKAACDTCTYSGRPPCAAREIAMFIERLYVSHGGDPLMLTSIKRKNGTTKIVID